MNEKLQAWKTAFAGCMRIAIDKGDFSAYQWFDLGEQDLVTEEEIKDFYKEREEMFLKVFGEPLEY